MGRWWQRHALAGSATRDEAAQCLVGLAEDVASEAGRRGADALVIDYMQPQAICAGEALGVPVAALVHTLYQRVALGPHSPIGMYGGVGAINDLRGHLGLAPIQAATDLLDRAARVLVATAAELDRPEPGLAANVRYLGPLVQDPGPDVGWQPPPGDEPLIHVSLGTIASRQEGLPVLTNVIEALGTLPVRVHVSLGGILPDPDGIPEQYRSLRLSDLGELPANVRATGYVRHAAVFPHVDLFITHAGLSGIGAALRHGIPMLCLPLSKEQPANAAHVAELGVGVQLSPDTGADELRAEVHHMLSTDRYRLSAQHLAANLPEPKKLGLAELHSLFSPDAPMTDIART